MRSFVVGVCFIMVCVVVVLQAQKQTKDPSLEEVLEFIDTYHTYTPIIQNLGNCSFYVSCEGNTPPDTVTLQQYMGMGVCMIHSFWPSEALRAFREVLRINASCAMGYWGLNLALQWDAGFVRARAESIQQAQLYGTAATEREQLYINAEANPDNWDTLYRKIMAEYSWDLDASLLWGWNKVSSTVSYIAQPLAGREEAQIFLKNLTVNNPHNVALNHYIIHAWEDTTDPAQALDAVASISSLPVFNGGHTVHMPGHIFHRLGDHDRAYTEFLKGYNTDVRVMEIYGVNFQEYWEFIHNIAYMSGNLGEGGRRREAVQWGTFLLNLQVNSSLPLLLDWDPIHNRAAARYYFQGLLTLPLLHFQYSDWAVAQQTLSSLIQIQSPLLTNTGTMWLLQYFEALQQYACVLGSFNSIISNTTATACYAKLSELYQTLAPYINRSSENGYQVAYRAYTSLGVNKAEAEGILFAIQGNFTQALVSLAAANASEEFIPYNEPPIYTRPVLKSYAEVLLKMADLAPDAGKRNEYLHDAVKIYQEIISSPWHNNSGFGLYGLGYAYSHLGEVAQATTAFTKFLEVWKYADNDLAQVQLANSYLAYPATSSTTSQTPVVVLGVLLGIFVVAFVVLLILFVKNSRRSDYRALE